MLSTSSKHYVYRLRPEKRKRNAKFIANLAWYLREENQSKHDYLFFTFTFATHLDPREAGKRVSSFWFHELTPTDVFDSSIRILEAGEQFGRKKPRVHFHLIARGFPGVNLYSALDDINRLIKTAGPRYGIGKISEAEIIRDPIGIVSYLAKDLVNGRTERLFPNVRIINYSRDFPRTVPVDNNNPDSPRYNPKAGRITTLNPGSNWYRNKIKSYFVSRRYRSFDEVYHRYGSYWMRENFYGIKLHIEAIHLKMRLERTVSNKTRGANNCRALVRSVRKQTQASKPACPVRVDALLNHNPTADI